MGWSYGFWIGSLYPEGTRPEKFLDEYAKHFDSVELDSTFYRIPSAKTVKIWEGETPEGFLFSAKFPRIVTHVKMLRDCQGEVETFISRMANLHDKLGPLLLQFPSTFGSKNLPVLREFLQTLPKGYRYAVEVRNKGMVGQELISVLKERDAALVLVDERLLEEKAAADFVYVRWEGDRREVNGTLGRTEVDRTKDIEGWAARLKKLLDHRIEIFGYFSKYYSGYPPGDAERMLKSLL